MVLGSNLGPWLLVGQGSTTGLRSQPVPTFHLKVHRWLLGLCASCLFHCSDEVLKEVTEGGRVILVHVCGYRPSWQGRGDHRSQRFVLAGSGGCLLKFEQLRMQRQDRKQDQVIRICPQRSASFC